MPSGAQSPAAGRLGLKIHDGVDDAGQDPKAEKI
jgi:hypothetical protein